MQSRAAEFYRRRDQRTNEYLMGNSLQEAPVHVQLGPIAAQYPAGQLAFLSLINQLARVHNKISVDIPNGSAKVLIKTTFLGTSLAEVAIKTMSQIDPYGNFTLSKRPSEKHFSIGIGVEVGDELDWYIGADRAVAYLQKSPATITPYKGSLIGAALAACLGASAMFRAQLGRQSEPRVLSAWNYKENKEADFGPEEFAFVDIGRVLMVGAGAVGASLIYWLCAFGISGENWSIMDADEVELHNTNRGLIFTAEHAGWPNLKAVKKVDVVAPLIGATPFSVWYDQCKEIKDKKFDVILALANDREVRKLLACRNAVVSLQATTGNNWLSQLHRHILGKDGCIWCRTGKLKEASFGCSTAKVERQGGKSSDAALPFLSAASALMLATALLHLQRGSLVDSSYNCWSWDFDSEYKMASRPSVRSCRAECGCILPHPIRQQINKNSKWIKLVS